MSAPHIPNLLSSRGGPRSRGRGRGNGPGSSSLSGAARKDQAIRATDTDAAVSRLSAVGLGYLEDRFAGYFVAGVGGLGERRLPIINRGTYVRTTAIDRLIESFPASPEGVTQIISLGAGTDTRFFRLRDRKGGRRWIYHEFDFPSVIDSKREIVKSHSDVFLRDSSLHVSRPPAPADGEEREGSNRESDSSPEWSITPTLDPDSHSKYYAHPLDIRSLASSATTIPGLNPDLPTLILSECCLCYLPTATATSITTHLTTLLPKCGLLLYEPIGAKTPFGQMMVANLKVRGIEMPTVAMFETAGDQVDRLVELGFGRDGGGNSAISVRDWWGRLGEGERRRVDSLEGLDEVEEWELLAGCYAFVWGGKGINWGGGGMS